MRLGGIAVYSFLDWPPPVVALACTVAALVPPLLMTLFCAAVARRPGVMAFAGAEPAIIGTVSLLFGLFAAFLANDIWTRNQTAREAVVAEGDAIRNLARLSEGNDQATDAMRAALADYVKTVVEKDWPLMLIGKRSLEVLPKVKAISALIITGSVGKVVGPVVQGKMLDAFTQLREKRQVRTILAESRTFTIKWHALILFGFLTQLAITITHLVKPKPMLLSHLVFGSALATCLSILVLNEFPFSALNPVSPDPLTLAAASLFRT